MSGFGETLIRIGMIIGFWVGLATTAMAPTVGDAVVIGVLVTGFAAGLIVWDIRKAWKRHQGGES